MPGHFAYFPIRPDAIYRDRPYFTGMKARLLAGFLVLLFVFVLVLVLVYDAKLLWVQPPDVPTERRGRRRRATASITGAAPSAPLKPKPPPRSSSSNQLFRTPGPRWAVRSARGRPNLRHIRSHRFRAID